MTAPAQPPATAEPNFDTQPDEDILAEIDALADADRVAFLTGKLPLAHAIFERIRLRVEAATARLNALAPRPPVPAKIVSGLRLYSQGVPGPTGGAPQAEIVYGKLFLRGGFAGGWDSLPDSFFVGERRSRGVDAKKWLAEPSASRLAIILEFSALPGASRHHWGTEVDFNSTTTADWLPASDGQPKGRLSDLDVWLQANAARAGFVQAYPAGRASGYDEEQWHFSYAPLSVGLRSRYNAQVDLATDVAGAFLADMEKRAAADRVAVPADLQSAVEALQIGDYVNDIDPTL